MFDSKLKKLGKNVVLGFFAAITSLLTLLCLFNNAYLSWDEHTTIVADKPFYLLLWFVIVLFFVYFVRKHYRTQDTYYFNKIFIMKGNVPFYCNYYATVAYVTFRFNSLFFYICLIL